MEFSNLILWFKLAALTSFIGLNLAMEPSTQRNSTRSWQSDSHYQVRHPPRRLSLAPHSKRPQHLRRRPRSPSSRNPARAAGSAAHPRLANHHQPRLRRCRAHLAIRRQPRLRRRQPHLRHHRPRTFHLPLSSPLAQARPPALLHLLYPPHPPTRSPMWVAIRIPVPGTHYHSSSPTRV